MKYAVGERGVVGATGNAALEVGQRIPVAFRDGKPIAIIAHNARRAKFPPRAQKVRQLVEALFVATNPDTGQLDVWFRNYDQVTPLNLGLSLIADPVRVIPLYPSTTVLAWGERDNTFLVAQTPPIVTPGFLSSVTYHVCELSRPEGRAYAPGESATASILRTETRPTGDLIALAATNNTAVWNHDGVPQVNEQTSATLYWPGGINLFTIQLLLDSNLDVLEAIQFGNPQGAQFLPVNAQLAQVTHGAVINVTKRQVLWTSAPTTIVTTSNRTTTGGTPLSPSDDDIVTTQSHKLGSMATFIDPGVQLAIRSIQFLPVIDHPSPYTYPATGDLGVAVTILSATPALALLIAIYRMQVQDTTPIPTGGDTEWRRLTERSLYRLDGAPLVPQKLVDWTAVDSFRRTEDSLIRVDSASSSRALLEFAGFIDPPATIEVPPASTITFRRQYLSTPVETKKIIDQQQSGIGNTVPALAVLGRVLALTSVAPYATVEVDRFFVEGWDTENKVLLTEAAPQDGSLDTVDDLADLEEVTIADTGLDSLAARNPDSVYHAIELT